VTVLDLTAVDRLRQEPVDWRYKGMPPGVSTVEDLVGRRVPVDGFTAPVAALLQPALSHNLDVYARFCAEYGFDFAPHIKTTMAPQIAAEQARRGAWGFTVANVAQARVLRAFGARRILLAHGVTDPAGVAWLAAEQEYAEIACWVDSLSTVDILAGHDIPVFVELGAAGGRTGARGVEAATEVVRAVRAAPGLRFAGVAG
jgi:D-serine deaminase-like pyridoxal phosphate-dependent protein